MKSGSVAPSSNLKYPNRNRRNRPLNDRSRRAAITVLAAVFMVVMLGFVAFGIDVGYMAVVKTQLQNAADSAAMAAAANMGGTQANMISSAQQFAGYHMAGGAKVNLVSTDIQYGTWDSNARTFTSSSSAGNAIKVTARRDNATGANKTFFGRILGVNTFNLSASAVALRQPARYLLRRRPVWFNE